MFIRVSDAFAFVGLRLLEFSDAGGGLTDELLVSALDQDLHAVRDGEFESCRNIINDSVGITEVQSELRSSQRGFVALSYNLR